MVSTRRIVTGVAMFVTVSWITRIDNEYSIKASFFSVTLLPEENVGIKNRMIFNPKAIVAMLKPRMVKYLYISKVISIFRHYKYIFFIYYLILSPETKSIWVLECSRIHISKRIDIGKESNGIKNQP